MASLGDVLELLDGHAGRAYESVRMSGRSDDKPLKFWWHKPDRKRIEEADSGFVRVHRGDRWWTYHPEHGAASNEGRSANVDSWSLELLCHPRGLLAAAIDVTGEGEVIGRPAIEFSVRARPSRGFRLLGKWGLAEGYDAAIDAETGVVLHAGTMVLDEIAYDEPLDDALFQKPIPDEVAVRVPPVPVPVAGGIEELKRRTSFPLLVPTVLPETARLVACSIVSSEAHEEWAVLTYVVDPGALQTLHVSIGPGVGEATKSERGANWTTESIDGIDVHQGPDNEFGYQRAYVDLGAMQAYVIAQPGRGAAIAAVTSLEPA